MHGYFGFDGNSGAGDFAVAIVFFADLAVRHGFGVTAFRWRVIAEAIQRVFAGMEARRAGFNFALMLEGLTQLELETTAGKVLFKALIRCYLH